MNEEEYSPLVEYAKSELELLYKSTIGDGVDEDGMQEEMHRCVLELIKTFSKQGHSGLSGAYCLSLFERLVQFKPILPLTGEENEWGEPYGDDDTQQNTRCGQIFRKHCDNSTAYDIEGRIFRQSDGITYTTKESRIPVIFPYTVPEHAEVIDANPTENRVK